jgi:hypothetical protein
MQKVPPRSASAILYPLDPNSSAGKKVLRCGVVNRSDRISASRRREREAISHRRRGEKKLRGGLLQTSL